MTIPDLATDTRSPATPAGMALIPVAPAELVRLSIDDVAARLVRFSALYAEAMSTSTVRAVRGDWKTYYTWCRITGHPPLGISRDGLRAFLHDQVVSGRRRATIDRYLYTIRLAHRATDLKDPTDHPEWNLMYRIIVKGLAKDGRNRPRPAAPMRQSMIEQVLDHLGADLRSLRDAALLCLASDTLVRREELARIRVDELRVQEDGSGVLEVPNSKTDQEGLGKLRPVSRETMQHFQRWLQAAGIESGAVFRAVTRTKPSGTRQSAVKELQLVVRSGTAALAPREVSRIFSRRLKAAGIDATRISGHSTRIGSTHDLLKAGYSIAQIAQNGGWANEAMVLYYCRELMVADTPMADARRRRPLPAPE